MSSHPLPPPSNWFDAEDPPTKQRLDTCIHCGLCLTACPTYRDLKIEPDSPRGRLYLMRGLAEGRIAPDDELTRHLDQCLGCRACETVCPAGVPYGRLLEETRAQLTRRRPPRTPLAALGRWALTHLVPHRGRMHLAADFLRLSQSFPVRALMRSPLARRLLPSFALQGYEMTPELAPRQERALAHLALPGGARLEQRPEAQVFLPAGAARARVGFFTTCVMETMFPHVNQEAVRLLLIAGCEVWAPHAQTCCGALQAHAGLRRVAKRLARHNAAAFQAPFDHVVTTSAGCGATLRDTGHLLEGLPEAEQGQSLAARTRDVSEVLAELGLPEPWARPVSERDPRLPLRVGYHDPCHLVHGQKVRREPRALLDRLPEVERVDLPNADWCCGSAGVYNLTHPEMAAVQLEAKLDAVEAVSAELVVASNPGCLLHMQRGARARGLTTRFVHLVEVLGMAYPPRAA